MYMPIWIIYWFPFIIPVNYGIKFAAIHFVLWICKKITNVNDICTIAMVIKSLCFTVASELTGLAMFCIIEMNTDTRFYYDNYLKFCLLSLFCVVVLTFVLNHIFVFRKSNISTKQKLILTTSITIVTAPYMFLIPSGFVY